MAEVDPDAVDAEVLSVLEAMSSTVFKAARTFVAPGTLAALERKSDFVLVMSSEFNGMVRLAPDRGSFQLALNYGLVHFYREMTAMLFRHIVVLSESQYRAGQRRSVSEPFEQTVEVARNLMKGFWDEQIFKPPTIRLEESTARFSEMLFAFGLRFVIGHELGHVLLEVSNEVKQYLAAGQRVVADFLDQTPSNAVPSRKRDQLVEQWGKEFACDLLGLELAVNAETDDTFRWVQPYAAEWFFTMCDMLWKFYSKRHGSITLTTHPAPFMRLDVIRSFVKASERKLDITEALKPLIKAILDAV